MDGSGQERLQVALDAAGMGTFVWYASEDRGEPDARMLELFSLPPDGVLSLSAALTSMIHPDDRQLYADAVGAAFDPDGSRVLSQEIRVDRGDGSYRWVLVTARAFFEGSPPRPERLVGVAADVTRRRQLEEELRAGEERRSFLLRLADRLRLVTDPVAVQALAVEMLGRRLGVSRALYLEVVRRADGDVYTIERDYHAPEVASVVGRYRADDFGATLFDELRAGHTLTVADVRGDERLSAAERARYPTIDVVAFVAVPLVKDGRHVAALVVQEATAHRWTDEQVALVEEVAERTWAAVERAKVEAALRESEARFRQVVQVTPQLIWVSRSDGTLEMLNDSWAAITGVTSPDGAGGRDRTLLAAALHPSDRDGFLVAWDQARTAGVDFDREARLRHHDGGYRWNLVRVVGFHDGTGGVAKWFGVATDVHVRRSADDRALAEQTEGREREHGIAVELQRALLPAGPVDRADVAIAARYEAGSTTLEVGGDWYDTLDLPDGRVALAVGDVVGHGLAAATAMGKMRVAMRALAPHAGGPGRLLSDVDGFAATTDGIDFVTACYATFDPTTRELRYASAGHPPMLVVTDDGRARWLNGGRSAPIIGRVSGIRPEATETLEPGAVLVMYSDGLIERRREPLTAGLDRLERAAVDLRHAPVAAICDGLLAALGVAEHRADDVVVLCLRAATQAAEPFHRTLPAQKRELSRLRRSLRAWRRAIQPADHRESDLLLAVNEACANAIEHAYVDRPDGPDGTVEVTVAHSADGSYLATVRDSGTWRTPTRTSAERGRGLGIIRAVSQAFERRSTTEGTIVAFRLSAKGTSR